jgi:hypothetical protein
MHFLEPSIHFAEARKGTKCVSFARISDFRTELLVNLVTSPPEVISESDVTEL